jgi:hypothetical protein
MAEVLALPAPPRFRLVPADPVICAPWHLRGIGEPCADDGNHPMGSRCQQCGTDIAIPRSRAPEPGICLYCAMDQGLVALEEVPPCDD